MDVNKDRLNLSPEAAIEPLLPVCDAHHHLWQPPNPYLIDDLLHDISGGHNIVKTVFVESWDSRWRKKPEALSPVQETEFVIGQISNRKPPVDVAAGIIGFADFMLGDAIIPLLEAHIAAARNRFRGIRIPRGNPLSDPQFRKGFAHLRRLNLAADAFVQSEELPELADLAKAFPDTPIIINHMCVPAGIGADHSQRDRLFREWQTRIAGLSAFPNIYMKLGGLGMVPIGFGWQNRATPPQSTELAPVMAPFFLYCIERFGVNRCMLESNFPPDKKSYSYTTLWNTFKRVTGDFSAGERGALFHDTAVKVYRL